MSTELEKSLGETIEHLTTVIAVLSGKIKEWKAATGCETAEEFLEANKRIRHSLADHVSVTYNPETALSTFGVYFFEHYIAWDAFCKLFTPIEHEL